MFRSIDIIFFSINWENYFDRSILVISMTVLTGTSLYIWNVLELHFHDKHYKYLKIMALQLGTMDESMD